MPLERKFSLSTKRISTFEFCPTAYFYKYIYTWNAWDKFAPQDKKIAYQLKNLLNSNAWLSLVFKNSIKNYLREIHIQKNKKNAEKILSYTSAKEFFKRWEEAISALQPNPENLKLFSISELIYQQYDKVENFKNSLHKRFYALIDSFQNSKLHSKLLNLSYLEFVPLKNIETFLVNNVEVCVSPDFLIKNNSELIVIHIYANSHCEVRNWDVSASISTLLAMQKLPQFKEFTPQSTFFQPEELSVFTMRPFSEILNFISEKSSLLLNFEKECKDISNVPKNTNNCHICDFRKICPALTQF